MSKSFEKFCLAVILAGSALILFLPLFVYQRTLYPYIFSKIIVFRIIVEILLFFWLLLVWSNKKYRSNWKNPLVLSLTIFIGLMVLTGLTGVDPQRSFWSTQERMTGVITWLHFWAWFLILTSCFKEKKNWLRLVKISLLVSVLVGFYALGQRWGWNFLPQDKMAYTVLSGSFGNNIFLAVYSMIHLFLAGFLFFKEERKLNKTIVLAILIFNLYIMSQSGSRGAMVGLGAAILIFLILKIFSLRSLKTKIVSALILFILIAGFVFINFQREIPWMSKAPYFIQRLSSITRGDWSRTTAWGMALQGFKEKPILGRGWENFNVLFNLHYHPHYLSYGPANTWFDRSHNEILDILCLTGILGLAAYLALFFSIFYLFKKSSGGKKNSLLFLFLLLIAYFVQNLFVFDTPGPLIVFFFSLGLFYRETSDESDTNKVQIKQVKIDSKFPLPVLLILLFIFIPWGLYEFNFKPLEKSKEGIMGIVASLSNLDSGLKWYKESLREPCFTNPEVRLQLVKTIFVVEDRGGEDEETIKKAVEFAIEESKKNVSEHPLDVRYWLFLGQIYNANADLDSRYLIEAEKALEQGIKTSLKRQDVYFELGKTKMMLEKDQEAIELYQKALSFDTTIPVSRWNLGLAYLIIGQNENGLREIEKAQEMGFSLSAEPKMLLILAQAYKEVNNCQRAIEIINYILELKKDFVPAYKEKIACYINLKEPEKAGEVFGELQKIAPEEAKKMLKQ